ncbi:MAG: hypothetical protein ACXVEF_02485 [Polyangiales bacterium]
MKARHVLPIVALAGFGGASSVHAGGTEPAPASSSSGSSAASPAPTTATSSKKSEEPAEIEVIDLNPEPPRDPQRFAVGGQVGGMWMTNRGSGHGSGAIDFAFLGSFGLGAGGARVPFTLEVWVAAAIVHHALNLDSGQETAPNRFTEVGVRLVYHRVPSGGFSWISLGGGLAWTSTRQLSDDTADPLCNIDRVKAKASGIDCGSVGDIAPGALFDVGFGIYEWMTRGSRAGVGLRFPGQISHFPGIGAVLYLYGQAGLRP